MSTYDVRTKIKDLCVKYEKNYDMLCVGSGETFARKDKRYIYKTNKTNEEIAEYSYIIKYYSAIDRYIVWSTAYCDIKRTVFSVSSEIVNEYMAEQSIHKAVEYSGWGEEKVLVFNEQELEVFIQKDLQ